MISIKQKSSPIIYSGIFFAVFVMMFIFMANKSNAFNEKSVISSKSYSHCSVYVHESDITKRSYATGTVNVTHKVEMTSASTTVASGTDVNFSYDTTSFTFNASGGAWDTPLGVWVNSIDEDRSDTTLDGKKMALRGLILCFGSEYQTLKVVIMATLAGQE